MAWIFICHIQRCFLSSYSPFWNISCNLSFYSFLNDPSTYLATMSGSRLLGLSIPNCNLLNYGFPTTDMILETPLCPLDSVDGYCALPPYLMRTFPNLCYKSSWTTSTSCREILLNFFKNEPTACPERFMKVLLRQMRVLLIFFNL